MAAEVAGVYRGGEGEWRVMANDRVMLKCKVCEGRFGLLSYFPMGDPRDFLKPWAIEGLEAWLNKHCEQCHADLGGSDLEGDPRFVTECE